uniref:T-cell immunomodulatory protein n=1 Tax=Aceria tosichella TaxID=561515 RepID=A0A6G1SNC4_9ACAR
MTVTSSLNSIDHHHLKSTCSSGAIIQLSQFTMKRRKKSTQLPSIGASPLNLLLVLHLLISLIHISYCSITFNGIPAAFGDLDLNKRTDIVVIGDDGTRIDLYLQHQRQVQPALELGFSCKTDKPIVQVYLADIDGDGNPNLLPLILVDNNRYQLKSLKVKSLEQNPPFATKLQPNAIYSLALNSENTGSNISNNSMAESLPLKREPPNCELTDLGMEMRSQPLLFDLEGDLRTDFMGLDNESVVSVWTPPKPGSGSEVFEKMPQKHWSFIKKEFFSEIHSNSFIDVNHDNAADIVLSSGVNVAYLFSDPDPSKSFRKISKEFSLDDKYHEYGQSSLADINADGTIDHIIPRCHRSTKKCEIIILIDHSHNEVIFKFDNYTGGGDKSKYFDYRLEVHEFATNYKFPITLRASDLDGDGYTDFVAVAKNYLDSKNKVIYLRNIPDPDTSKQDGSPGATRFMTRTFDIQEIHFDNANQNIHLVTLFDINEDGKVDMLIGASESDSKPHDMNVTAKMNSQMVDACFMKVLVTNGFCSDEAGSNGQSARGPFICFELSQNDGKKMQGCAGQLAQSSHFALQQPYVIFGLGQTPHFVETLNVSIPGFGPDRRVRTRVLEQIVPDAQVIIIPKQKDNPNSWDYKMFLSPMSDLVFSTLIALAGLCLLILFIIFILHRQETKEDAAEHEEYKRHWPESR